MRPLLGTALGKAVVSAVVILAIGTAIGLVTLWPSDDSPASLGSGAQETEAAEIVGVSPVPCRNPAARDCKRLQIELQSGANKGARAPLTIGDAGPVPELSKGDELRVTDNGAQPGAGPNAERFALSEIERRSPMILAAAIFALLVVLFGRLRGALALAGLAISLLIVVKFVVPAILDGTAPLAVAIVSGFAIMIITITLAHGLRPKSLAAILGTAVSLVLTIALAVLFTELTHLTGFGSEEAGLLQANNPDLSLTGLVVAGMVIGALGVLDDVTVSQASTVMALRHANPTQGARQLYRGALGVGRDHVAATVNTLVLAYVGSSLSILLIFAVGGVPFADAINREAVSEQIVAMLVGSIGLIAAVPVTTALAALLAARMPADQISEDHAHAH